MPIMQLSSLSLARNDPARVSPAPRAPELSSTSPSVALMAVHLAQELIGMAFLVLGVILIFTLVLMPIGLPLALVGVALIVSDQESEDRSEGSERSG
jgi:hypothetical protein